MESTTTAMTTATIAKDESTTIVATENNTDGDNPIKETEEEEENETQRLMKKVKESGVAGVISYAAWELAFWTVSVPVCVFGYREITGHWPDFKDKDDLSKLGAEAFAFVNFARFAVPLRIGLALSTTPWIQDNVVDVFLVNNEKESGDKDVTKEEDKNFGIATTTAIDDEGSIAEATEDDGDNNIKEEEQEGTKPKGRFRILNRVGKLTNRILRPKSRSQQSERE